MAKHIAILSALCVLFSVLCYMAGCTGCALVRPEGEATFQSVPADWPGVKP